HEGKRVVGISSGASAPEELVQRLIDFFRERGTSEVAEFEVVQEDVRFMLPKEIRKALAAQAGAARRAGGGPGAPLRPCPPPRGAPAPRRPLTAPRRPRRPCR